LAAISQKQLKMCVFGQSLNIVIKRIILGHKILKMELLADILACLLDLNFKQSKLTRLNFKQAFSLKLMLTLLKFQESILPFFFAC